MAPIRLTGVTKRFDTGPPALDALSLTVAAGEFVVLLGPSGCGKTTALRCIAGLDEPTAGSVHIGDRDVTHLPAGARDVAMVFQNYALYPHLTVAQNLAFPLELRRLRRAEITRRVAAVADRLGLGDLLARRPAELSGGQRQRVALGRAIVREPAAFLFDEPLSNLDAKLRSEMRAELLALHRSLAATMVYVTHDQVEAMTMGQRLAVLHHGRLRQLGTPAQVYARPADAFVAQFVGNPGMNLLAASAAEGVVRAGRLRVAAAGPRAAFQLGVRPEHVALVAPGTGDGDLVVRLVEPLGAETLVHLEADGARLVAKVRGLAALAVGSATGVRLDTAALHYFDATGARIA